MLSSLRLAWVVPPKGARILAISDIHGELFSFQALLSQVNFTQDDVLFIVGDLLQKGAESLAFLRYVIALSQTHAVHTLMGNQEAYIVDYITNPKQGPALLAHMLKRPDSLPTQMCAELGIELCENTDIAAVQARLCVAYAPEIAWLKQLPHLIETPDLLFAHSGMAPGPREDQTLSQLLRDNEFHACAVKLDKPLIVGHMPTANLCGTPCCCNPILDDERSILFIDGGNCLKTYGQLNALILPEGDVRRVTFTSVDRMPKARVRCAQQAVAETVHIRWPDYRVEVLDREGTWWLCRKPATGHTFRAPASLIGQDGVSMADDFTDHQPALAVGNVVSIVEERDGHALIKHKGVVGWTLCEALEAI